MNIVGSLRMVKNSKEGGISLYNFCKNLEVLTCNSKGGGIFYQLGVMGIKSLISDINL